METENSESVIIELSCVFFNFGEKKMAEVFEKFNKRKRGNPIWSMPCNTRQYNNNTLSK
jgi:hypothetical protein